MEKQNKISIDVKIFNVNLKNIDIINENDELYNVDSLDLIIYRYEFIFRCGILETTIMLENINDAEISSKTWKSFSNNEKIYIDLSNNMNSAIEISSDGEHVYFSIGHIWPRL